MHPEGGKVKFDLPMPRAGCTSPAARVIQCLLVNRLRVGDLRADVDRRIGAALLNAAASRVQVRALLHGRLRASRSGGVLALQLLADLFARLRGTRRCAASERGCWRVESGRRQAHHVQQAVARRVTGLNAGLL